MKTTISEANGEVKQLKKDKENLTTEVGGLRAKTGKLESYLGQLAAKLVLKLEGIVTRLVNYHRSEYVVVLSTHCFSRWNRTLPGLRS